MKSKILMVLLSALLVLSLTACTENAGPEHDPSEVVATVNGVEITYGQFAEEYEPTLEYYIALGEDMEDEAKVLELKNDILEYLISNEILIQEAAADDYEVSEEKAEELYVAFKARYEDEAAYQAAVEEQGLTDDEVKAELINQDNIDHFLNAYAADNDMLAGIVVTQQEVENAFKQYVINTGQTDLTLEEAGDWIYDQLMSQKTSALVGDIVEQLREKADVEILISFE